MTNYDAISFFYQNIAMAAMWGFLAGIVITWLPKIFK
jgi:hypothetical protein